MSLPDLASIRWESPPVDQAASLRQRPRAEGPLDRMTAVVSGKGGVGKTIIVANLAVAAAGLGARVLVVDGDMGLSNLDLLMGLSPKLNVVDVLTGRCSLGQALVKGPKGIELLPAGSGRHDLTVFEEGGTERLMQLIAGVARDYDLILVDAGAGIGRVVVELALASSRVLLVAVPEPTSYADAYATCKTLWNANPHLKIETLINCSENVQEGRRVHAHLEMMCDRFLNKQLNLRGILPRDRRLREAVVNQRVVVEAFPNANIAKCFADLAQQFLSPVVSENSIRDGINFFPLDETRKGDALGNL
ncbi:MAG: AAA family ATPase [Myxococcales bacterium]|nr:AAA family ATPase [Myxococcales bacterium]